MARTKKADVETVVLEQIANIPAGKARLAELIAAGQSQTEAEAGLLAEIERVPDPEALAAFEDEDPDTLVDPEAVQVGIVPLDQQLTEAEEAAAARLLQGEVLPAGDHPWSAWHEPTATLTTLDTLRVTPTETGFRLTGPEGEVGTLAREGLLGMGYVAGFPADFLPKLSRETAATVMNERLTASGRKEATVLSEDGRITCFITSRREIMPAAELAQLAWDTLEPLGGLTVEHEHFHSGRMELRLLTGVEQPITRSVGDLLGMGAMIRQIAGEPVEIALYARRLVCLNGMIANRQQRSWRMAADCTRDAQRAWVTETLNELVVGFRELADRARTMAATRVHGDPEHVLLGAARAMRLPRRFHNALLEAFHEEPGETYWHVLNAITRLGTHGDLPENLRFNTLQSAGDWTRRFEMTTARLPLPIAVSVGAQIIETHQPEE